MFHVNALILEDFHGTYPSKYQNVNIKTKFASCILNFEEATQTFTEYLLLKFGYENFGLAIKYLYDNL